MKFSTQTSRFNALALMLFAAIMAFTPACKDNKNTPAVVQTSSSDTIHTATKPEQVLNGVQPAPIGPDSKVVRLLFISRRELEAYGKTLPTHTAAANANDEQKVLPVVDTLIRAKKYKYYITASNLLHQIKPGSPLEPESLKLQAYCRYNVGDRENAIAYYEKYAAMTPQLTQEHEWALCLYYMADFTKHEQQFRDKLQKILTTPGHAHLQQARELEEEMKQYASEK